MDRGTKLKWGSTYICSIANACSGYTIQAMIHELLGTKNNTIDLGARDDVADELKQLTLSASTDEFYRHNMYANFGEIGQTIQKLVQNFQEKVIYIK